MTEREELLLRMYDQLFNDIDRHILVVWQSIGTVVGGVALFSLAEKNILPIDIAAALAFILIGWMLAHAIDSSYWYNRNLVMIANIERQFLQKSDLKDIHYYFGKHRPKNAMITHLRIQCALGLGLGSVFLLWHFVERVLPGMHRGYAFDPMRALPYAAAVAAAIYVLKLNRDKNEAYSEFTTNSPGIPIDTVGIRYGVGHGFRGTSGETSKALDAAKTQGGHNRSPSG